MKRGKIAERGESAAKGNAERGKIAERGKSAAKGNVERGKIAERGESAAKGNAERGKSAAKGNAERGKSAALRSGKPDHYDAAAVKEIMARNPWMNVADGLTFKESERVNYDPATGLVVKAGTPDTVPLGEVVLFVPATDGRGAFAAIFTDEKFYREYTLTGKDKPPC